MRVGLLPRSIMVTAPLLALGAAVAIASTQALAAPSSVDKSSNRNFVPCAQAIDHYPKSDSRLTLTLGRVALVPKQGVMVPGHDPNGGAWPLGLKHGVEIGSGKSAVTISIPRAWQKDLRITWGYGLHLATAVTFEGCPGNYLPWSAYSGGFELRHFACVHLLVSIGASTSTVRVPLGKPCGNA
jgi:hypothetical protein